MAEKSVVSDETDTDAVAPPAAVVDEPPLVVGVVVVFFDELHAASPAAVNRATDQIETRLTDNFILPPPVGLSLRDRTEINMNEACTSRPYT
jgi:hypothetical protein